MDSSPEPMPNMPLACRCDRIRPAFNNYSTTGISSRLKRGVIFDQDTYVNIFPFLGRRCRAYLEACRREEPVHLTIFLPKTPR